MLTGETKAVSLGNLLRGEVSLASLGGGRQAAEEPWHLPVVSEQDWRLLNHSLCKHLSTSKSWL